MGSLKKKSFGEIVYSPLIFEYFCLEIILRSFRYRAMSVTPTRILLMNRLLTIFNKFPLSRLAVECSGRMKSLIILVF